MGFYGGLKALSVCVAGGSLVLSAPAALAKKEIVLYSFCQSSGCPDGQFPYSPLVQDKHGNLFGTTDEGGNASNAGTIYELQKVHHGWVFHSLYRFCPKKRCRDGNWPAGGLIVDTSGNLYGTTYVGGFRNYGVVYELQRSGRFRVLYRFCVQAGCPDGARPLGGLTYQGQQNGALYDGVSPLYGTTQIGGAMNWGTVFSITPGGAEWVLYTFGADNNANDGQDPEAPLIIDVAGNLYGTTTFGGSKGDGTIFGISPSGSETLLFAFCSQEPHDCGITPEVGALLLQPNETFFGTTPYGGRNNAGVVYSFTAGTYTTLASFCGRNVCRTGSIPIGGLMANVAGTVYGVAQGGGKNGSSGGTVFELVGSNLKAIYSFCFHMPCTHGSDPASRLLMDSRGRLFGTTNTGGAFKGGTVFELR